MCDACKSDNGQKLAAILECLARRGRHATYGAVGGVLGVPAQSVMTGHVKNPLHSRVVAKGTRLPTGYATDETDPDVLRYNGLAQLPIDDPKQLTKLLEECRRQSRETS
jgi:hypothetical protein